MVKEKTFPVEFARYLETDEIRAEYLEAGLEEGHMPTILAILGAIAKSRGCVNEALNAGLPEEFLTVGQLPNEMPDFATVLAIIKVLGLRLHAGKA